jgi:hypothetical protein
MYAIVAPAYGATTSRLSLSRTTARTKSGVSGGIQRGGAVTVDGGAPGIDVVGATETEGNVATKVGAPEVTGADETGAALGAVVVLVPITGLAGASSSSVAGDGRDGCTARLSTISARIDPSPAEMMSISERRRCGESTSTGW